MDRRFGRATVHEAQELGMTEHTHIEIMEMEIRQMASWQVQNIVL